VPTQQTLRNLQTAFKKKRDGHQSAEYTKSAFKWDPDTRSLTMARIGRLAVRWSRTFTSDPTTATITKSPNGRYHVTLVLDEPIPALPPSDSTVDTTVDTAIGIDPGIHRLATLSNGERIPNPRHLPQSLDKLAKAQRTLSRRQKGSGRWNRQKQVVARLVGHIAQSLPIHIRQWSCPACQVLHDRDENAARNILAVGHRLAVGHTVTARGGSVSPLPGQLGAAVAVEA
jgi:putative transposase